MTQQDRTGHFWALLPLFVFVILYFCGSLYLGDFYALPVLVVFVIALFVAFLQYPKKSFEEKLKSFAKGSGDENILVMILIFLLAGAFSELSKSIGALESTVNFAMTYVSPRFIVSGIFLISCFVSISLGTSVGTIVALSPLAVGFETYIPGIAALTLAAVVGGAMFGDNLSFISDTTIAATRTQKTEMHEKFRANFRIVFPVALVVFILYYFQGAAFVQEVQNIDVKDYQLIYLIPYTLVFLLAFMGLSVIWTLGIGILAGLIIGWSTGAIDLLGSIQSINSGFAGMFELSILCLVIGGVVGIIKYNGGIDFLLNSVLKNINSKKGAELGIAALTAVVNCALANNTITIVIVGPLAKEISDKYQLQGKRVASIMDTVSCFVQGVIPYGAQILAALAASSIVLAGSTQPTVSPIELISYLYYPFLTGIATVTFIFFNKNK